MKMHTTITHKRDKNKPKFNFNMVVAGFLVSTTMLSTVIATPAYAKEAYSTTALTQTMTTSSSYELEQFKSMLKKGILDVEMLSSINDSLSSLLSDIEKGKIDTYSEEFRNIVVSNTLAIDMIDNSEGNLSTVNGSLDDAYELLENSVWDNLDDLLLNIRFKDVKTSDWFNLELQSAAARGLIDGKGDGIFDPQGTLTVAEAIKLAASARAMYDDELDSLSVNLGNGHWADNYVSYAKSKGIVNGVSDLDKVITRDEMAKIFASALPTSEYEQINDTSLMPEKSVPSYVEKLFKAGIMIGDSEGFRLNDSITRAETACIINRVILPGERVEATADNKGNSSNQASSNVGNNSNTSTSAKYTLQKDPTTGKYIPFNDPAMSAYNRPEMIEFIYGSMQNDWYDGSTLSYKSIYGGGVNAMAEAFGGIDIDNSHVYGLYSKNDFDKIAAGDYIALPKPWLNAHMLVAERLDGAIVVVMPTPKTISGPGEGYRWKIYTWDDLDKLRQTSEKGMLSWTHNEFNGI